MTTIEALKQLQDQIYLANKKKGFWEIPAWAMDSETVFTSEPKVAADYKLMKKTEKICLMHSELSEALEGIRKDAKSDKIPEFTAEEEELADCMIRIFDHAGGFNLRLAEALFAKLDYNTSRPHKHGKAF